MRILPSAETGETPGDPTTLRHDLPDSRRPRGGAMSYLEVSAHMTVRPGCLEGFKKQAAECVRITQEKDTRTLRYDWFLSSDGTQCEVREAYADPEGLIEHNSHILEARTKLFKDFADGHFMTFYGDPSTPLLDLLKTHAVGFKWFSFMQGLDASPVVPFQVEGTHDYANARNQSAGLSRAEAHRGRRRVAPQR
jgi:quinol monooxygenase YgiN